MSLRLAWAAVALGAALACQQQQNAPLVSPSSDQPGYAARYPDEIAATRGRFAEHEGRARRAMATFATFPDELDKPSWPDVQRVYDSADAAGKSAEYVERLNETNNVSEFFTQEKDEINKKVGGAAQYTAKQKGCTVELYGATAGALDKAVEKQLEKRLRERNEAHRYIDEHEEALGKPNREKLEKQADEISHTSYLVRIGVEEEKRELEALVAQANDVKGTLDKSIEEYKAAAGDAKRSDADKKKAQARLEAAEKAKGRIESEVAESEKLIKETEDRIKAIRGEYDKALEELKKKVESKSSAGTS